MFTVKLVARPDARMVEVPLEIEAELPREFEGAALLASSGLPRKVKIKSARDALKLSTAYRADQLLADIVRSSLRGTPHDVQRVQDAVTKFIRTVRERRQEGATLTVTSNGRGKIEVLESAPAGRGAASGIEARLPPEKAVALERRLSELETAFARIAAGGDLADRISHLEERLTSLQGQLSRTLAANDVAGPGMEKPGAHVIARTPGGTRRVTAVEAFADGLRNELRARASAALARSKSDTERCDKAAALAAEAELLGAPADGTAQRLRDASALAAAREAALQRLSEEMDLYGAADLPMAAQLLRKLEEGPVAPDPGPSLETVAQSVVRAAKGGDCKPRTAWLRRGAALCGWQLVEPERGSELRAEWHQALDSGGKTVMRLASPGLKRTDGSGIVRARVFVDPQVLNLPDEADEPQAVPEPLVMPEAAGGDEHEAKSHGPSAAMAEAEPLVAPPISEAPPISQPEPAAAPPPEALEPSHREQTLKFNAPFGDLTGESGEIRPEEAAAAATAVSRMPKIVAGDPSHGDDALAAEVALAVEAEIEEIHELTEEDPGDEK